MSTIDVSGGSLVEIGSIGVVASQSVKCFFVSNGVLCAFDPAGGVVVVVVMVVAGVVVVVAQRQALGSGRVDVLDGGGDGEVGGHGLHHLRHGLDLQPVGSDQRLLLLLERPVALVHGAELVAAAAHAVGPYGWTDRQTEGETVETALALM